MSACPECAEEPCRWYCPIHLEHHPVATMVEHCMERATS